MKRILFIACIVISNSSPAQVSEDITVRGSEITGFIAKEGYKYPNFKQAKVYFNNSSPAGGFLNYNYLLHTMQFVSDNYDTLVIANETDINYISISGDTFFYDNGFFENIATAPKMRLAVKRTLKTRGEPQKLGAFGIPSATTGITSEGKTRSRGNLFELDLNEVYIFTKKTAYYISAGNKPFEELNKKTASKLFPKKADEVNDFIKKNKIDFNRQNDLLILFSFLNQIS